MEASPDEPSDALIGTILDDRYEVVAPLGEGGMGIVYRARHVLSGGAVAVKVLRAAALSIHGVIERVEREARAASAIGDPHIVDVRDFGRLPSGEPYLVMELLEGQELTDAIAAEGALPLDRACHVADQLAQALAAAHAAGIVHRDLKAENVLLVQRPEVTDFVKLVDFGIAHVQRAGAKITRAGEVLGTPQYMSPEQCAGLAVDHRTDVYAFGILLYEMLTGAVPFEAETLYDLCLAQIQQPPPPPSERTPDLPEALEAIVLRCLEKRPEDRFGSMDEVRAALRAVPGYRPRRGFTPIEIEVPPPAPVLSAPPAAALPSAPRPVPTSAPPPAPARGRGPFRALGALTVTALIAAAWTAASLAAPEPAVTPVPAPRRATAVTIARPRPAIVARATPRPAPRARRERATPITVASVEGATVRRGGALLGTVPLRLDRPEEGGRLEITVSRPGYRTRRVVLSALTDEALTVPLERAPRRARAEPPPEHAAPEPEAAPEPPPAPEVAEPATRSRPFLNPWAD